MTWPSSTPPPLPWRWRSPRPVRGRPGPAFGTRPVGLPRATWVPMTSGSGRGSVSRHDFLRVRLDGTVDDSFMPAAAAHAAIDSATRAHGDLSQELGPSTWSDTTMEVSAEGKVRTDFKYADPYTPGDLAKG